MPRVNGRCIGSAGCDGRAVAVLEAMIGQIFLATLVARLVASYHGPGRR